MGWTDRLKRWMNVFSIQRPEISVIEKSTKRKLTTQLNVYNTFLRRTIGWTDWTSGHKVKI